MKTLPRQRDLIKVDMFSGGSGQQAIASSEQPVASRTTAGYRSLIVWKESFALAVDMYRLTQTLPDREQYGIASQMRRAAFSIPANIAEGYRRRGKDYKRFLRTSFGSASELETYLLLCQEIELGRPEELERHLAHLEGILRMLSAFTSRMG